MSGEPFVQVSDLHKEFRLPSDRLVERRERIVKAVDGVNIMMTRGETLAIVGETGSGKSTLGRVMLALQKPTSGTVSLDGERLQDLEGEDLRLLRKRMQMIFQDPYGSLNPRRTVEQAIIAPLKAFGVGSWSDRRETVARLLDEVGLSSHFAQRFPHELSGGQQQRIAIARALALNPDFVVADEPVSALDVSVQAQILNLLSELQTERSLTYLLIAHDLSIVRQASDRIAVMYFGKIVEVASGDDLYEEPLHPYTAALLSAIPVPDPVVEMARSRIVLEGDPPSPTESISGCRFRNRCPMARDECRRSEPPLTEWKAGHFTACFFPDEVSQFGVSISGRAGSGGNSDGS